MTFDRRKSYALNPNSERGRNCGVWRKPESRIIGIKIHVFKDTSEVDPTSETHPNEEASEETHDGS